MAEIEEGATPEASRASRSWPAAIAEELREHPMAYAVMAAFVIAGPVVTHVLFPEAPRGVGLIGGMAFGVYAALCAMPQRYL
jgi:hypothetical protein